MKNDPIVIVSYKRTPIGNLLGQFKDLSAHQLGAKSIRATIKSAGINAELITDVIMGCVLTAGQGQAPARQAALTAGIPESCRCVTINKMCGSAMQAVMYAHDMLISDPDKIIIAGGMESMTNAPFLQKNIRNGMKLGHTKLYDHMMLDGLEDAYTPGKAMGVFADETAKHYNISKDQQDQFALTSFQRAIQASKDGTFAKEICDIEIAQRKSHTIITKDERLQTVDLNKIATCRPAFSKDGTVSAANASSISDGASSILIMRYSKAIQLNLEPKFTLYRHASISTSPQWFTRAPVEAIKQILSCTEWSQEEVDLYEINEAFAVVTLLAQQQLQLPLDKLNIHGGACAIGHPIGASGTRIIATLLNALETHNLNKGIASVCIGGGEATAVAIERTNLQH